MFIIHVIIAILVSIILTLMLMWIVREVVDSFLVFFDCFDDMWPTLQLEQANLRWIATAFLLGLLIAFIIM